MKKALSSFVGAAILLAVLAGCAAAQTGLPAASPTATVAVPPVPAQSETPRPTAMPTPQPTLSPSSTGTTTITPTPTQIPSETGTPRPIFAGFQVGFVDYAPAYGMQFAFIIPGIRQNYGLDV